MSKIQHISFFAMGTRCSIVLPEIGEEEADDLFRLIKNEIARIEGMLSRFKSDSMVCALNKQASKESVVVNRELFRILKTVAYYYQKTGGYFDVTLRPLLQHWKENSEVELNSIKQVMHSVGMDKVRIEERGRTVFFAGDDIELDFGGFGKGYALERVNDMLLRYGLGSGFLTMGESSILTLGQHPAGDCWKVGIKNYKMPDSVIHTYHMKYGSVSTSSNFFVADDGKIVHHQHVINPKTGMPVEELVTVSVFSQSAVQAEVLSTAFLVMPENQISDTVEQFPDVEVLKVDYQSDEIRKKIWD